MAKAYIDVPRLEEDFQIIQRDENGFARVIFDGEIPEHAKDWLVVARVEGEDDNSTVVDWTPVNKDGCK